jgi:uncharacterized protein (TIGR00369 family)
MAIATILDRFPTPECARLLGLEIIEADPAAGRVKIAFEGRPEFCNPRGFVQGGLLAAMLDDCMGPAVLIHTDGAAFPATINLNVSFLAPARPGRLIGEGRVVQLGKTVGFAEAELTDAAGVVVARASASLRIVATARALG